MSITSFPIAAILDRGRAASERRFALGMQRQAMEAQRGQTQALIEGMNLAVEAQEAQLEVVSTALSAMNDLMQVQIDADLELRQLIQQESDESQRLQVEDAEARAELGERLHKVRLELLASMQALLSQFNGWTAVANGTAGGVIGRGEARELLPGGWPHATSEFRWHFNNAPRGWLHCGGGEFWRVDYPNLAAVMGDRFGPATSNERIKLPFRSQCPGYLATLPGALRCWVRT